MVSTLALAGGSGLTTLSAVGLYMLLTGKCLTTECTDDGVNAC